MNKYFWNNRKHETYEDLLNAICSCIYHVEPVYEESYGVGYCKKRYPKKIIRGYEYKLFDHYELTAFFKKFRHNEKDGFYHKEDSRPIYGREVTYDENGYRTVNSVVLYHKTIPAWFEQKPWIVIDSYDRVINSKDLKIDALKHNYDPNWEAKYRKPRKFTWTPTSYRNGRWQKYLGNHAGSIGDYAKDLHHNDDKEAFRNEYGVTYKVRAKRTSELYRATDWDGGKNGWIEKGWKQTRKAKQWM